MSEGAETLWAVVLGALLATAGGFAATRLEELFRRREREREAALLFGEILAAIELIARFADNARQRGDPYGAVTMRLMRGIRREVDVYDRDREALYALRDPVARARIHTLMVRLTMALDGVFDSTSQIAAEGMLANSAGLDEAALAQIAARIEALAEVRHTAFDFAMETIAGTPAILAALRPLARHDFNAQAIVNQDF